ncbi:hypothetical protein CH375_18645 [Leptospira ellisii]|nr:hypothetical protein CH379_20755 [Leptospira ellisii]PKA03163.1 hypothetical protein CH375_18645 [Leptospira ellisii]
MNPKLKESIEWHFREGYSAKKTWEVLEWSYPGLKFQIVTAIFEELESQIPKAGFRKETIAA